MCMNEGIVLAQNPGRLGSYQSQLPISEWLKMRISYENINSSSYFDCSSFWVTKRKDTKRSFLPVTLKEREMDLWPVMM